MTCQGPRAGQLQSQGFNSSPSLSYYISFSSSECEVQWLPFLMGPRIRLITSTHNTLVTSSKQTISNQRGLTRWNNTTFQKQGKNKNILQTALMTASASKALAAQQNLGCGLCPSWLRLDFPLICSKQIKGRHSSCTQSSVGFPPTKCIWIEANIF